MFDYLIVHLLCAAALCYGGWQYGAPTGTKSGCGFWVLFLGLAPFWVAVWFLIFFVASVVKIAQALR